MSESIKKSAIVFKQRAKELGYEIKLTHCQEILAKMNGHKTRHSFLLREKPNQEVDKVTEELSINPISNFINHLLSFSNRFQQEELDLMKSDKFQEKIEKVFFETLIKEVISQKSENINAIASIKFKDNSFFDDEKFDWELKEGFLNNVKSIINKNKSNEYCFEKYIEELEQNKYKDLFLLGLGKKEGKLFPHLINYFVEPNAIFVGSMGSGKSVSNVMTTITWMLSNSDQSILYIVDLIKGANDYKPLFNYKQVIPIIGSDEQFINMLRDLYQEAKSRITELRKYNAANLLDYQQKSGKNLSRILVVIEEMHTIMYNGVLNFDKDYKTEGTAAFHYHQLMRIGRSLGIWFNGSSQRGTRSDIPVEILPNFTQKNIFRVSKAEALYFMGDLKASEIRSNQKGRCETDYGTRQYPYISIKTAEKLLNKYMKPLQSSCLFIDDKLMK